MTKRLLMTCAALAMAAGAALGATGYQDKEAQIQQALGTALERLIQNRDAGTLDDDSALVIIQEVISPQFDYEFLTRFVVGKHWRKASDAEKGELIDQFRALVERTYSKSLAKFNDQEVEFMAPEELKDGSVNVGINVLNKGKNVRIEYLLKETDGEWVVTDVKIENVSLLGNFRRQFSSIVRKDGVAGLIEMLKSKA